MSSRAGTAITALRSEALGKWYRIGEERSGYALLSERIAAALHRPLRGSRERGGGEEGFWALKDISFEIERGEAVGLVGRNGAGKSTLLKIMSRITLPTEGRVTVYGRTATLLEVGTGFSPELTGGENIYLNGAILGMRRAEIASKYDEIAEFSGIERFLDTPVKRYSSGMYVRLAFAVAAHLEPEILFVDEVLAVGDAEFQKRCLGKMKDVADEGRAVVFVSHNLAAVQRLCTRAMMIDDGRLVMDGEPGEVVAAYLDQVEPEQAEGKATIGDDVPRFGTGEALLRALTVTALDGRSLTSVHLGQPFRVDATFEVLEPIEAAAVELGISTVEGQRIATVQNIDGGHPPLRLEAGMHRIGAEIELTLLPGEFVLDAGIHRLDGRTVDWVERALRFTALNVAEEGEDHWPWPGVRGYLRPPSRWSATRLEQSRPLRARV